MLIRKVASGPDPPWLACANPVITHRIDSKTAIFLTLFMVVFPLFYLRHKIVTFFRWASIGRKSYVAERLNSSIRAGTG
jgi:hypothetical protein